MNGSHVIKNIDYEIWKHSFYSNIYFQYAAPRQPVTGFRLGALP